MKHLFLLMFLLVWANSFGQISKGGQPLSFSVPTSSNYDVISIQPPQLKKIHKLDSINTNTYRVAVNLPCQIDMKADGTWQELDNGYKIWRLAIDVPNAKGLGLYFSDEVTVPENGKLFIYNQNKSQIIGALTSNTPPFKACEVIAGDKVIIEYQTLITSNDYPNLHINKIAYFYRGFEDKFNYYNHFNSQNRDNGDCEVNVACDEGLLWQKQIDATVVYTFIEGQYTYVCSASILNNTNFNCKPFILTADHCGHPTSSSNISNNVWYFNYQNPNCEVGSTKPYNGNLSQTMTGGNLKSSSSLGTFVSANNNGVNGSDFVLVELNTKIPESYHPYFAGWSLDDSPSNSGVCIHHPAGSDKKISTYAQPIFNTIYNSNSTEVKHWGVVWSPTQSGYGVTEGGSSGSPLFNSNGQVIGSLSGGASTCESPTSSDLFGKFNFAWTSEGVNPNQQLKFWLDSSQTNYKSINGSYYPCSNTVITDSSLSLNLVDVNIYPNPTSNILYIDLLNVKESVSSISITDITGKIVYQLIAPQGVTIINFTDFAIGTYFVKLESENEILIKKIIKI